MLSMLKEALEWLNRAEEAREVAGQGKRSWRLPKASIGSPEPLQSRLCSGEGGWRGKTANEIGDYSHAFRSRAARCLWIP